MAEGGDGTSGVIAMRISFGEDGSPTNVEEMPPIEEIAGSLADGSFSQQQSMQPGEQEQMIFAVDGGQHSTHGSMTMQVQS